MTHPAIDASPLRYSITAPIKKCFSETILPSLAAGGVNAIGALVGIAANNTNIARCSSLFTNFSLNSAIRLGFEMYYPNPSRDKKHEIITFEVKLAALSSIATGSVFSLIVNSKPDEEIAMFLIASLAGKLAGEVLSQTLCRCTIDEIDFDNETQN